MSRPTGEGEDGPRFPTSLGTSTASTITLLGEDLANDLMGSVGLTELAYRLVTLRTPTAGQVRMLDACLLALADHGFTPTAIAARLTYLSAPDSVQGAMAAGLLGGGSRFLGVTEDCGQFLHGVIDGLGSVPTTPGQWDEAARDAVREARAHQRIIPGLGHPVHKRLDPRTPALVTIATEEGCYGPHLALFEAIGRVHPEFLGRTLVLNGAGVVGAGLADLGLPVKLLRGFALVARAVGLLGQLAEEERMPVGMDTYLFVERHAEFVDPARLPAARPASPEDTSERQQPEETEESEETGEG
ncbi:citryl-CoA lyase [Streptomyces sp. NRRL F-5126]|uniref:citryl-CoA lyase n=1 Tax=Streptomyces sp. NRRL F-5126 TaxID=1463857 RepID=UPI00099C768C|nr:citryl-CoA lyase [Streptomyces sp. NRRL F-5126]